MLSEVQFYQHLLSHFRTRLSLIIRKSKKLYPKCSNTLKLRQIMQGTKCHAKLTKGVLWWSVFLTKPNFKGPNTLRKQFCFWQFFTWQKQFFEVKICFWHKCWFAKNVVWVLQTNIYVKNKFWPQKNCFCHVKNCQKQNCFLSVFGP